MDPTEYHAIVCVGGDGIVYEVVNGLASRQDGLAVLSSVPIAVIPSGSGNGLVKSALFECSHAYTVTNAIFMSIRGIQKNFDLSIYEGFRGGPPSYSFLNFSTGLIADVDIHTEPLRALGELRYTLGAIYYAFLRRTCRGRLAMFTSSSSGGPASLPPLSDPSGPGWETIEGEFNMIWVLQTTHASSSIYSSPTSRLSDGVFTILVASDCSTFDLLHLLILADSGDHIHHPKVKKYAAKAFRFEPLGPDTGGIFSLDGELKNYGPIQARVLPSAARLLSCVDS